MNRETDWRHYALKGLILHVCKLQAKMRKLKKELVEKYGERREDEHR